MKTTQTRLHIATRLALALLLLALLATVFAWGTR